MAETSANWRNLPNAITFARLVLSFVVLMLIDWGNAWVIATGVFIFAAATDFVDGYLARKWQQITTLGRIMDPLVDKVLIGGSMIFLTALPASGVTAWMTFAVVGREMFVTALRSVLEGQGIDFSAKFSGKLKMLLQSIVVPISLLSLSSAWPAGSAYLFARDALLWAMVAVTIYSGVEYAWRGGKLLAAKGRVAAG